jgi:predicted signal transduction protein with EAL and GGDEF domain
VLLNDIRDEAVAEQRAEAVLRLLRAPLRFRGEAHPVSASVGLVRAAPGATVDQLLREADIAMYAAKSAGRNRVAAYDEQLHGQVTERSSMEAELRAALAAGQVDVVFQPIVRGADLEPAGFEALARWVRPRLGEVAPSRFVGIALASPLAVQLDRYVLRRALTAVARFRVARPDLFVSVNFSSRSIDTSDVEEDILGALAENALPGAALVVELRETELHRNEARWFPWMARVADRGVRFALDDFGLGQGSLARLESLPVAVLKLDRQLVRALIADRHAIAPGLVQLALALGRTVVAEGVETEEQRARLVAAGCTLLQGHLFGHPERQAAVLRRLGLPTTVIDA